MKKPMNIKGKGWTTSNRAHQQFLTMLMMNHMAKPEGLDQALWEEIASLTNQQIDNVSAVYSWLKECWDDDLIPGLVTIDKTKNGFIDNLPLIWELIIEDVREGTYYGN